MYACTKFQLIWATSDFGIKIAQKNIDDKSFLKKKNSIKIEAIYVCTKFQSV